MSDSRRVRLDTPRDTRRSLVRRPTYDSDAFGSFAEQFARFMGTARFLMYMTLFVIVWMLWNTLAPSDLRFDRFPFIFLTLMLSLQASYAAPLILLAQNRQEQRDKVIAEQDRQANARAHADMEFLAREVASLRMSVRCGCGGGAGVSLPAYSPTEVGLFFAPMFVVDAHGPRPRARARAGPRRRAWAWAYAYVCARACACAWPWPWGLAWALAWTWACAWALASG